ncbi:MULTISPECIES: endonuclease/exonuclease/phosphatase family protein [Proteiniphilum]|jgi:endonuclease/exonuclease/phosphatase family metal-dependent hydrolase|uniref:endonuclease/exonuclease/phosphatase family protein n=1 Tax=Proteiniphilum TaxID=294702 RepID=UPI001EEBD367|nr:MULTISPECIES: endonuclease/exonuclease/phosphatase family protein [Proteiniphilum]ULB35093.1 endonuclease/exonuclease/phosphatase family protein [Proteiniphilum propionicum]
MNTIDVFTNEYKVTKKQIRWVALLTFICSLYIPLASFGQEIKVMTYNIYHGEEYYSPGEKNLEKISAIINKYKPDFVAMQEVDSMTNRTATINNGVKMDVIKELAAMTGMYGFFGKAIPYSEGGYGEGVLSRFPSKSMSYNLPTPSGGEGRALLMIEHTFSNGQKIIFAGTHLCHQFPENRLAQTKAVCNILKDSTIPVVMGGDLNFTPDSPSYQEITKYFEDVAKMRGKAKYTFSFDEPSSRIDYIFVSKGHKWRIKNVKVIKENASDHMPVLVTLELKK